MQLSFKSDSIVIYMCYCFFLQVLYYAIVIHKDMDIGLVVVGDLYSKNQCVQLRQGEVVDVLALLRRTQLGLLYSGLGLEERIDDIVEDIPVTRILLNEFMKPNHVVGEHIPN